MHERFRKLSAATPVAPSTVPSAPAIAPSTGSPSFEAQLIAILRRGVESATSQDAHRRKEHEIGEVFAKLTVRESWTLHKRLSTPSPNDELANAFGGLVIDRRGRLLAFLGDARRRASLAHVK